ncbi:hypothetical protein JMJ58_03680 [Haloterrigena salifodinae]|uniref:Uncharacterized protein n=1 Tax=Haloterrigena salifodinae TaxID=2675099 RepID=A0A8T8E2N3_9EURY|nr:hypothetical protein [Haloterrigena salifodinae]QRV16009.1 hypothetical protein JMJ58_03680 [Haloterrigena salifodinae]
MSSDEKQYASDVRHEYGVSSDSISQDLLDELIENFTVIATCPECGSDNIHKFKPGYNNKTECEDDDCDAEFWL